MKNYRINTYANSFGVWQCAITYPNGLGNSGEAQAIIYNSITRAKRSIRQALIKSNRTLGKRVRYTVFSNDLDSMNRLHGLVITEA